MQAVRLGQASIAEQCQGIEEWTARLGKEKRVEDLKIPLQDLDDRIMSEIGSDIEYAYRNISLKKERSEAVSVFREKIKGQLIFGEDENAENCPGKYDATAVSMALKRVESRVMRNLVLREGYRADGRGIQDVRPIWSKASLLPRTHGSALFTRGETQAIAVTTLGCKESEQKVDSMASEEDEGRRFYLQYFFPPSSVGETGRVGAPGRREIGHGNLAERALAPIVPSERDFPYTIRVESTITESNGSSSMASVCGGCLSMLDAGMYM
jgi:polyribonucleotide nucleotidyltransferase